MLVKNIISLTIGKTVDLGLFRYLDLNFIKWLDFLFFILPVSKVPRKLVGRVMD